MLIRKLTSQSRITEVDSAVGKIIEACEKGSWSDDPHMTTLLTELRTLSVQLNRAINQSRMETVLDEKDARRDEQMRGLYYLVQGCIHHPAADISAAAQKLSHILQRYGLAITRESYDSESSLIASLLTDLTTVTQEAHLLPGVLERINSLTHAQKEFDTAALEWEEEQAAEKKTKSASEIKKDLLSALNDRFVVYLRAMVQLAPSRYGEIGRTVAEIIHSCNSAVERRSPTPVMEE